MNEEKPIHKFLNKERKPAEHIPIPRPKLCLVERKKLIYEQYFNAAFIIPVLLQHFLLKS